MMLVTGDVAQQLHGDPIDPIRPCAIDDTDHELGAAERRRQRQSDHAPADDEHVEIVRPIVQAIVRFQPIGDRRHGAKMGARAPFCPARSRRAEFVVARKFSESGGNGLTSE